MKSEIVVVISFNNHNTAFASWHIFICHNELGCHNTKFRVVAVSLMPQRVVVVFSAQWAFSIFERNIYIQVKWSRYWPGVAQRMGRGIALLFHDRGTRRGWVVSSSPRPHFTPGMDPVSILQEAGWAPGPVWKGGKSRLHRDSIPDRPARSQSLYRLSYPTHIYIYIYKQL